MKEYAFDVKLAAVIRIKAASEIEARQTLKDVFDCASFNVDVDGTFITEASLDIDDADGPHLFEVGGEPYD